jgi:hypothetical protein
MCYFDSREGYCHREEQRDPQECTPEQIRECHGDVAEFLCEGRAKEHK